MRFKKQEKPRRRSVFGRPNRDFQRAVARRSEARRTRQEEETPVFQSTISRAVWGGVGPRPHVISYRPVVNGANLFVERIVLLSRMVEAIRNAGARVLERYGFARTRRIDARFAMLTSDGNASRYRVITRLSDITEALIEELFEDLLNSDTDLDLITVEFQLILFRDTWIGGRGRKTDTVFKGVACAAVALVLAVEKIPMAGFKEVTKYKTVDCPKAKAHAVKLQELLGWKEFVAIPEIADFVKQFPKFRVTVLTPLENSFTHHTFTGQKFVFEAKSSYMLYLALDVKKKHYTFEKFPKAYFARVRNNDRVTFCEKCIKVVRYGKHDCCGEDQVMGTNVQPKTKYCEGCEKNMHPGHKHNIVTCANCKGTYDISSKENNHRCVLMAHEKEDLGFYSGGKSVKGKPALWIYDIESGVKHVEVAQHVIQKFAEDEDGYYKVFEHETSNKIGAHYANLLCAKNPYTGEKVSWEGEHCIDAFVTYLADYNEGDCIALAHNGSGYDTRLIYEYLAINRPSVRMSQISNGSRILQLDVNVGKVDGRKLIFRDTLLHLASSLRGLTAAFNDGSVEMAKGYYPHLFNTPENTDYVGPIPGKEFFDITFSCRSDKDREDFLVWYEKNKDVKDWNNREEKKRYCENDVECLAMVVMNYTRVIQETYGLSPFKYVTGPAMVHALSKKRLTELMELGSPKDPNYIHNVEEAAKNYWAVLKPQEYVMCKEALRGGRTDARKMLTEIDDEMWDRGERIKYVDVCSMYPWEQAVNEFPVGYPQVHVVNDLYRPCFGKHRNSIEFCSCPRKDRYNDSTGVKANGIWITSGPWDLEKFKGIGGYVACDITAPNMLHPVLIVYDKVKQKAIAPCGRFTGVFTINAINVALAHGYVMNEVFRVDIYKMAPSLWEDLTIDFTIGKMCASEGEPDQKRREELVEFFEKHFEAGDRIARTFGCGKWGRNELRRSVYKILNNCGWGKHCQAAIKDQKILANYSLKDEEKVYAMYANVSAGLSSLKNVTPFTDNVFSYTFADDHCKPDLSNSYLAAGAHVPDYGRLTLWRQMNALGKRVIYNDTDSVVYHHVPGEYEVPPGVNWGEWEEEKISKAGIRTFAAFGAKSYAAVSGGMELLKLKGISVNRAHGKMLALDKLIQAQKQVLATGKNEVILVPQQNFVYRPSQGIKTNRSMKKLTFSLDNYKGAVDKEGYVYPPGYTGSDFEAFK